MTLSDKIGMHGSYILRPAATSPAGPWGCAGTAAWHAPAAPQWCCAPEDIAFRAGDRSVSPNASRHRTDFEAPLQALDTQLKWSVLLVGLLFTGLALRFARSIVRPIRALTQAAGALKEGQYDGAGVEVQRRDELGQLGRTFNVMIDVLRQRERERRRDGG
jgi:HAMP domain-containing protein